MLAPTLFEKCITIIKKSTDIFHPFGLFLKYDKIHIPQIYKDQLNDKNWDALKIDEERFNGDNDTLVTRVSQEFPKMSHKFTKLSSEHKPWGKKKPEQFNWEDSTKITKFEKGRWYYSNVENSNHLDLIGWPSIRILKFLRVLLGIENRFKFNKQLFERIYSLEYN